MSLSETCLEQRYKDEQKVKLWIVGGLVASAVIHGGIFALALSGFLDRELEITEEDAIEFIVIEEEVIEEEEIEPEPEEIVEEPEPIPEEIPEEIVEEFAPVEPPLEQPETASLQPAPPAPQSLPEPIPEPIAELPPPEPAPLAPPEPEPIAEEPPPEPEPAAEPAPDPLAAMSEEPLSEPEPLSEDLPPEPMAPPEPLADSAPPEPLASADIAPDAPMTSPLGELEMETGAANTPAETPDTNDNAPLGAAGAERSQPTQGAVPQPGTSGSPTGLEGSFAGIGSGESPTGGQTPGIGDQAFGGSPLDGRGGEAPGRPDGVEGGTGNEAGNETDTAYAGGGGLSCVDNCQPRYPNSLRNQGIEGTAIVRGLVGTDGRVAQVEIVQSSGNSDLDEAALEAASRMRFLPPDGGGSRAVRLPIQFTLN
ncbi:MAG: TonB family protein [Lyngbya sp.]|nr:TonB family protein [Lyngbya sp.]